MLPSARVARRAPSVAGNGCRCDDLKIVSGNTKNIIWRNDLNTNSNEIPDFVLRFL
jgi:hypothetical protein